ncbi:MAG: 2Fe-2S iron-sulfur cluster-binding protein [Microthrixaceae bacterium]
MAKTLGTRFLEPLTSPHSPADLFAALKFGPDERPVPAPQVHLREPDGLPRTSTARFTTSDVEVDLGEGQTLLEAAEAAGLEPLTGCRRGVCRRCVRPLTSGMTLNSRDSTIGVPGDSVRICVSTAMTDVEVDL